MFTEMQYGKYGGIGISYFPVEMSACIIICLFSCIIPIASSEYEMKKNSTTLAPRRSQSYWKK